MGKNQRKILNYLRVSNLSGNYLLYLIAGGVAFSGIMMIYTSRLLSDINTALTTLSDVALAASLQDRLLTAIILIFICFLSYLVLTVYYMVVMAQRVGGPIVGICLYIQELRKGNYDAKRTLRKGDELGPIMDELRLLAESLKHKQN